VKLVSRTKNNFLDIMPYNKQWHLHWMYKKSGSSTFTSSKALWIEPEVNLLGTILCILVLQIAKMYNQETNNQMPYRFTDFFNTVLPHYLSNFEHNLTNHLANSLRVQKSLGLTSFSIICEGTVYELNIIRTMLN